MKGLLFKENLPTNIYETVLNFEGTASQFINLA